MAKQKCGFMKFAGFLAAIGALNWGFVGLLDMDLVALAFGGVPTLQKIIYILVGISGLYLLISACMCKEMCKK